MQELRLSELTTVLSWRSLRFSGTFHHSTLQWGNSSYNIAPTASMTTPRRGHAFEKRNRPKRYEPLRRLCHVAPRSCRRSRVEAAERGPAQWRNTEQRPLERS